MKDGGDGEAAVIRPGLGCMEVLMASFDLKGKVSFDCLVLIHVYSIEYSC